METNSEDEALTQLNDKSAVKKQSVASNNKVGDELAETATYGISCSNGIGLHKK